MNDKFERQMKKGVLDMLVLKLLQGEPKYGYQIIQEMREKSDNVFSLKDGTLYPILYRLEDDNLVKSKWVEDESHQAKSRKPPRKYYEITPKGIETLSEIKSIWNNISTGITKIMEE